jgi:hypothetical protein
VKLTASHAVAATASLLGCGDNFAVPARCEVAGSYLGFSADCESAKRLAVRDETEFLVEQATLDRYLDVYQRGAEALDGIFGHPPVAVDWFPAGLVALNPVAELVDAWDQGEVETGVEEVDSILARADIVRVERSFEGHYALFSSHLMAPHRVAEAFAGSSYVEMMLAERLRPTESFSEVVVEDPVVERAVRITYAIGWGDCWVDCEGQHFWRVQVDSEGSQLVEEWGDPVPEAVMSVWREPNPNR